MKRDGRNRAARAAAAVVVAAAMLRCGRAPQPPLSSGQFRGANVLLVTIDTLRRDRVGAYGNPNGLTPTLDKLAAAGVRFDQAFSHAPMTLPAHTSILTGLTPPRHGVRNNSGFRLDASVPTLATILKSAGYRTGAFIGAFVLDARFGLNRGFDRYDDRLPIARTASFHFAERRAGEVVQAAGDWILASSQEPAARSQQPGASSQQPAASSQPWFAWVHLFDPHAPYDAPPEYRAGRAPYDAEIAYADAMLGRLLDRLRAAHALDRTLIVVTADHGESLGEHGETTHGLFAYDATIRVPLIISGGPIHRAVVPDPVAHVDIAPTIADAIAAAAPADLDGRSVARTLPAGRSLYFEALDAYLTKRWAPLVGVVQNGWKYIDLPEPELYNLSRDPGETTNLAATVRLKPDPTVSRRVEALRQVLGQLESEGTRTAPAARVDAAAAARLRSLGYVGGDAGHRRAITDADDPKRLVALNERFNSALTAFTEGRSAEALSAFESVLRERPDFITARTSAATVLISAGRPGDAVALLRASPPETAASPELLAKLGAALREAGDLRGAAVALERASSARPQDLEVSGDLAVVYARLGRFDDARALLRDALRADETSATTWYNLGLVELERRDTDAAADALRHAVAVDPSYGDAWQALGAALVRRDASGAMDAWMHAERLQPADYDLLFNLGMILADSTHPADALPYLERFVRDAPRDRYQRDIARVDAAIRRIRSAAGSPAAPRR